MIKFKKRKEEVRVSVTEARGILFRNFKQGRVHAFKVNINPQHFGNSLSKTQSTSHKSAEPAKPRPPRHSVLLQLSFITDTQHQVNA